MLGTRKIIVNLTFFSRRLGGFSFIELMIVIAIIGILAALVVLVNPGRVITSGRDAQQKEDIGRIVSAAEGYKLAKGTYPDTLEKLLQEAFLKTMLYPPSTTYPQLGGTYNYLKLSDDIFYLCGYLETEEQYYIYSSPEGVFVNYPTNVCQTGSP